MHTVLVSMNDLRRIKATVDNMCIEKMKAEKGDKSKKNKGKGKAKLRLDNSTVSCVLNNWYYMIKITFSNNLRSKYILFTFQCVLYIE